MLTPIEEKCLTVTDDMRILASAIDYDNKVHPDEVEFYTNDLCLFHIANLFFGNDSIKSIKNRIWEKEGIQVDQQRLVFNGKQLVDEETVGNYGISNDANIHLVLRLKGGC